jgi:hypothetical protein
MMDTWFSYSLKKGTAEYAVSHLSLLPAVPNIERPEVTYMCLISAISVNRGMLHHLLPSWSSRNRH